MAAEGFLSEFPPVKTEQWERIIREDLKGGDYDSRLIWKAEEGLAIRPYYRAEDLADLHFLDASPGEYPYVRGIRNTGDWQIREDIELSEPEDANRLACRSVGSGAESIAFKHARIESSTDVALLLLGLDEVPVHFENASHDAVRLLIDRAKKHPHTAGISSDIDPLADLDFSAKVLRSTPPGFRAFVIHADEFEESAAGAIEQVGYALAAAVDSMAEMQERGEECDRVARSLAFSFSIGPQFFIQIAKIRAFRMVWAHAVDCFGGTHEAARALVHARTAQWNKTAYDPHVNILRTTSEATSAILGGADSISIAPFDACYGQGSENSHRLARNAQTILKREAHLSEVADPVGGSYLIEVLTNSIATKSWTILQEIELAGGYQKTRTAGILSASLARRSNTRKQEVARRRLVLTGTNRYADVSESVLNRADFSDSTCSVRAATPFEQLRIRTERHAASGGSKPRIMLAEIGDAKMRSARSQFAADFFACAGFTTETRHFEDANQIASAVTDLLVLCSSDAEYLDIARALLPQLAAGARVMIAGNPDTADQIRALGISDFIHLRSNAVEMLSSIQQQSGIKE